mmetsp:Transcript_67658/g.195890  ORF Transcript_67658/g.195890 Transcript_67658/m.195890 type:complete len:229 (+) Transcript_67658:948-1634(+)
MPKAKMCWPFPRKTIKVYMSVKLSSTVLMRSRANCAKLTSPSRSIPARTMAKRSALGGCGNAPIMTMYPPCSRCIDHAKFRQAMTKPIERYKAAIPMRTGGDRIQGVLIHKRAFMHMRCAPAESETKEIAGNTDKGWPKLCTSQKAKQSSSWLTWVALTMFTPTMSRQLCGTVSKSLSYTRRSDVNHHTASHEKYTTATKLYVATRAGNFGLPNGCAPSTMGIGRIGE